MIFQIASAMVLNNMYKFSEKAFSFEEAFQYASLFHDLVFYNATHPNIFIKWGNYHQITQCYVDHGSFIDAPYGEALDKIKNKDNVYYAYVSISLLIDKENNLKGDLK